MKDLMIEGNGSPSVLATNSKSLSVGSPSAYVRVFGIPQLPVSVPANGTAATTVASSGTIDTSAPWVRITNAGAITGVIMEDGVVHGQICIVTVDKNAVGSVTMAAEATSNVSTGTGCVIAIGAGRIFIYDATDTCWVELGET